MSKAHCHFLAAGHKSSTSRIITASLGWRAANETDNISRCALYSFMHEDAKPSGLVSSDIISLDNVDQRQVAVQLI